jgi:hypothetical protein
VAATTVGVARRTLSRISRMRKAVGNTRGLGSTRPIGDAAAIEELDYHGASMGTRIWITYVFFDITIISS